VSNTTFLHAYFAQHAWPMAPAKRRFRSIKEVNRGMQEMHRLALTMNGVIDRSLDDLEGLQASDYSSYQIFEAGDLVFKLIDLENIKTSRVGLVPRRGIMSPAYIRLAPNHPEVCSRFYMWYFYAAYRSNIFNGMGGGVRQNLTATDLLEFQIPLVDLATQEAIADFLDQESARIQQLIERKERLTECLLGRKASLISSAVTGVDDLLESENPTMGARRPSRAARHLDITLGKMLQSAPKTDACVEIPYLRAACVAWDRIDTSSVKKMWFSISDIASYTVKTGDMVVLEGGDVGRAAFVEKQHEGFGFQNSIHRVRAKNGECLRFAFYWLMHMKSIEYFDSVCSKATLAHFTLDKFKAMPYPSVPESEQCAIVEKLDRETGQIDVIVDKTKASIKKLKEYRSSLIAAAVTGQIDVASWKGSQGQPDQPTPELDEVPA